MVHIIISAVLLLVTITAAKAQQGTNGGENDKNNRYCDVSVAAKIDMEKLKGVWWEKESFNTESFVYINKKCHVSKFYVSDDHKKIHVYNDYSRGKKHKKYSYIIEDKDSKKDDGHFVANMKFNKPSLGKKEVKWDILNTDYENFMLVQICHSGPTAEQEFKAGLLLVRNPADNEVNSLAPEILLSLARNKLDRSFYRSNNIKNCAAATFPVTPKKQRVKTTSRKASSESDKGSYCDVSVHYNIEMEKLGGVWWKKESFNTDSFVEPRDKCHVSKFYVNAGKKKILVKNDYISPSKEHKHFSYEIEDKTPDDDEGHFVARMNLRKPSLGETEVKWDILDTDYENFILVQICHSGPTIADDFKAGLLLVRNPTDERVNTLALDILLTLAARGLDHSYYQNNYIEKCATVTFPDTFTAEN